MAAGTYKSRAALASMNEFKAMCGVALGLAAETFANQNSRAITDDDKHALAYQVLRDTASYEARMARMVAYSVVITIGGLFDEAAPVLPSDSDTLYAVTTLFGLL